MKGNVASATGSCSDSGDAQRSLSFTIPELLAAAVIASFLPGCWFGPLAALWGE